jgi:hypothetical protein
MNDFKKGREIVREVMTKMGHMQKFGPLAMSEFFRMNTYSKAT